MRHSFPALVAVATACMGSENPNVQEAHRGAGSCARAMEGDPLPSAQYYRRREAERLLDALALHDTNGELPTAEFLLVAAMIAARARCEELPLPVKAPAIEATPHTIAADEGPAGILCDALAMLAPVERAECYDGATAGFAMLHDGRTLQFQAAWGDTSAALAALSLVGHPAIVELQRYCADAPAEEVGEGNWNDLDGACADGERQEQSRAAEKMRDALLALGLDAPAGHAVCSGCGRYIGDGHDSDCHAPRWLVTLTAEEVQVTAKSERHAALNAESDLNDSSLGPWNVSAEVARAELIEPRGEYPDNDEEPTNWEVELQDSEPDGSARLWTFTGTCELCIIAETADAALAEALTLQRAQLTPAAEGEG